MESRARKLEEVTVSDMDLFSIDLELLLQKCREVVATMRHHKTESVMVYGKPTAINGLIAVKNLIQNVQGKTSWPASMAAESQVKYETHNKSIDRKSKSVAKAAKDKIKKLRGEE